MTHSKPPVSLNAQSNQTDHDYCDVSQIDSRLHEALVNHRSFTFLLTAVYLVPCHLDVRSLGSLIEMGGVR